MIYIDNYFIFTSIINNWQNKTHVVKIKIKNSYRRTELKVKIELFIIAFVNIIRLNKLN